MNKKEFIKKIYDKVEFQMTNAELSELHDAFIDALRESLEAEENVSLKGIGTFRIHNSGPIKLRNPKTGEVKEVDNKKSLKFKPSISIKDYLSNK
jgi:integration host factor subunit beta